jgi:hypothetical protein
MNAKLFLVFWGGLWVWVFSIVCLSFIAPGAYLVVMALLTPVFVVGALINARRYYDNGGLD